ncbi:MAG: 50S ribosomal protein L21 [Desulfomonilia bacterium]|jgi:large subunit ribosomal protein L21|uniref:50S ribosomal subunit protein L21 n=1 Tax=anaerobic digester metagenome TaxID=1263854 RepID=A0A485LVC6_9ZZZZ|nr:50S ribosomal protein L21 [Pseudomonadota bacterium]HON38550.1 50S ribosomal protein L21 [Deltaproteobacteria bacterium]HRS56930.1 50S ribosomal protein L21 [Desulfomonilia bacterium]HPD20943.1 50S ribosomal protein L21 [Deltaproteobacteria bacterium]HPX17770.1 50S ribosomal protein L21 [Deltaproteobacteria bacterium]
MYAVIKTGGKQYKVEEGDRIQIEKLDAASGDVVTFDNVLFIGGDEEYQLGTPSLDGVTVDGKVVRQLRGKKIIVFKMKRRKGYRKKQGHRQNLTEVFITKINAGKEA